MSNNNFNQTQIRDAFGHFATGVCIMTAKTNGHDALGVTVNSFSSVSLDPPLLLWSLKSDAECFDAFYSADTFTVNVLNSEQKDICSRHANQKTLYLHPGSYSIGDIGAPVLNECLSSFQCKLKERISGGDHTIIIGEVKFINVKPGSPLLFFNGEYHLLAE